MKVRKASLSEVVRAEDLHGLVDISGVQLDSINRRKVVFRNQRPNARCPLRGIRIYVRKFACMVCSRGLMEGAKFCSLECKVHVKLTFHQGWISMPLDNICMALNLLVPLLRSRYKPSLATFRYRMSLRGLHPCQATKKPTA